VLSVYPLTGLTGLISLGQGALVLIGAYTAALLHLNLGVAPAIAIALSIPAGVIAGLIIGLPTLRLRRDYFLLITFGFSEMMRGLLLWSAQLTGGAMGVAGLPKAARLPLIAISVVVILFILGNLKRSRFGRTCVSIREDELAASALGTHVYAHKIKVFLISSAISAYGGAIYAFNVMFIEPNLFNWLESAKLAIIVFVGGLGSFFGVFLTAIAYYLFGEIFRFASVWRDVILAILVIVVVIYRHQGLFGNFELSTLFRKLRKGEKAG
jgi:branched-chain amino acid transport system permease protein